MKYQKKHPSKKLSDFIKFYWHLHNNSGDDKVVTVLPDGCFDLLYSSKKGHPSKLYLIGLSTKPVEYVVQAHRKTFAISFKLPAAEYLLGKSIAPLLNSGELITQGAWNISKSCFDNFDRFTRDLSEKLSAKLEMNIDRRKKKLFNIIYSNNGLVKIAESANAVYWSRRQINRYFQQWFGISMKEYCQILRYRSTFDQLNKGELYPQIKYADQSHFIREVKKYSSTTPKRLFRNKNGRFIQLSTL